MSQQWGETLWLTATQENGRYWCLSHPGHGNSGGIYIILDMLLSKATELLVILEDVSSFGWEAKCLQGSLEDKKRHCYTQSLLWQCFYSGYFGFISVQLEEVAICASLYQCCTTAWPRLLVWNRWFSQYLAFGWKKSNLKISILALRKCDEYFIFFDHPGRTHTSWPSCWLVVLKL